MKVFTTLTSLFVAVVAAAIFIPTPADAFCGFYVDGAGSEMFADATQVVMMREETRTVLSMQNRYAGPPDDFAMVVPVPIVVENENVKTLQDDIFARIDTLTSPRLVEYYEQDPCPPEGSFFDGVFGSTETRASSNAAVADQNGDVTVEAEFKEGEYQIAVLSTEESTALEDWLNENDYNIPEDAARYFEPYVQQGMYFFVARVNPEDIAFEGDRAVLSPLRFHYDSEQFSLPIRLGMINSRGEQDLIVNILARNQRYEVANRENVTIPTNLEVSADVAEDFASFYRALFEETVEENPGAAITEYAWRATKCDPCPGPVPFGINSEDVEILGADVLPGDQDLSTVRDWVITRLHLRQQQSESTEDLVFQEAESIVGGREIYDEDGNLELGATSGSQNAFQGRYIIRHPWTGEIDCSDPQFGNWGPPATDAAPSPNTSGGEVFGDGSVDVDSAILDIHPSERSAQHDWDGGGCGCGATSTGGTPGGPVMVLVALLGMMGARLRDRCARVSGKVNGSG